MKPARDTIAVETLIGWVLRGGVTLSVLVILFGLGQIFVQHPEYLTSREAYDRLLEARRSFHPDPAAFWKGIIAEPGYGAVMLGLLLLIATPVMRVATSVLIFVRERDRLYVAITSLVLMLLLTSFYLGAR